MPSLALSVLDLSPVPSGSTSAQALHNTLDLARFCDELGYTRYWLAEHHNSELIATSAPEVMIGHVASGTSRIRVGSGGVMLPNHAALKVAEWFRTLEALHPGRIDLGLGRAPGTDVLTAMALRRTRGPVLVDDFPAQLDELHGYLTGEFPPNHPFRNVTAAPAGVAPPGLWLLGSTEYGALLAAERGLAFAFAHHINPAPAAEALELYRERFQPSPSLAAPRALLAVSAVCAETDEEAEYLAGPARLTFLAFQRNGRPGLLPSAEAAAAHEFTTAEETLLEIHRERLLVGSPNSLRARLLRLARGAGVQEVMVTSFIHDHAQRRRSYQLLAEAFQLADPA